MYSVLTIKFPSSLGIRIFIPRCIRNEIKREGSGRGNWGTPADEIAP